MQPHNSNRVELSSQLESHEKRIKALENNHKAITIGKAMRILESHICMDIAGSRNNFRSLYNFEKIDTSPYKEKLEEKLKYLGLTNDHIGFLKNEENYYVHGSRDVSTFDDWKNFNYDYLCSDTDDNTSELVIDLLNVLKVYVPATSSTDPWIITDPINNICTSKSIQSGISVII